MKTIVCGKINCSKIDKTKLFTGKTGDKFLDITLIETENSKYGDDFVIVQAVSKEARLRGEKGHILGNARYMRTERQPARPEPTPVQKEVDDEQIPF